MRGTTVDELYDLVQRPFGPADESLCDVKGATGQLSVILAEGHPHLRCVTLDPRVEPITRRTIEQAGLKDR